MPKKQPLHSLPLLLVLFVPLSAGADDRVVDALFEDVPEVLTATRLKQLVHETPASITIIDSDMIRQSGARSLPEALRLVPGLAIGYESGAEPIVSYHGLVEDVSRRMQVLIDGRSVYEPALARIEWNNIPLAIEDILRIEITRGPNTAAYGANAFLGVINVITVQALDVSGIEVSVTGGDKNIKDGLVRYAGQNGQHSYRFSLGHREDNGFDRDEMDGPRHDSYHRNFLNAEYNQIIDAQTRWSVQAGLSSGAQQIQFLDDFEPAPFHTAHNDNAFALVRWQSDVSADQQRKIQAYVNHSEQKESWQSCIPRVLLSHEARSLFNADETYTQAFFDAVIAGQSPPPPPSAQVAALVPPVLTRLLSDGQMTSCGYANQNITEQRFDVEWQETYVFNEQFRMVGGASYRYEFAESETYFAQKENNQLFRLFANAEYRFSKNWLAHVGGMLENDSLIGTEFSPRFALTWNAHPQHTLRAIYARAIRSPDMFEENGRFRYIVRNLDTPVNGNEPDAQFYLHSESPGQLKVEEIRSQELGLNSRFFNNALNIDVKLFDDRLDEVIEGRANLYDFSLGNRGYLEKNGVETQITYQPNKAWRLFAGYSLLNFEQATATIYERSSPGRVAQLLVSRLWDNELETSLRYYEMQEFWQLDYQLMGIKVEKSWRIGTQQQFLIGLNWQWRLDNNAYFSENNREKDYNYGWLKATLKF